MAFSACSALLAKKKVLFIMGATGTGKTKLSIKLGTQFPSEIINSDKIQVYKGLDILVNKISEAERCGIPHHLLDFIDNPESNFTVDDFCKQALSAIDLIHENGHLPIIVGGSNNYLEALVENPKNEFRSKYDCCFIWLHVSLSVLFQYLDQRVDEMVDAGLVDEVREAFVPGANYSNGIRRAIGVPEFEQYLLVEKEACHDEAYKEKMLQDAIKRTKESTHKLAETQLMKICRLNNELGWGMNMIDSTEIFMAVLRGEKYMNLYEEVVFKPSLKIVKRFLEGTTQDLDTKMKKKMQVPMF
ncbi:P-loop containing nucleoside triphosphate hydrolase [Sesbania bispinosa]|nr:P-loop containing nucleoside triphosphate hydrolase [Sesbania bispinosa]